VPLRKSIFRSLWWSPLPRYSRHGHYRMSVYMCRRCIRAALVQQTEIHFRQYARQQAPDSLQQVHQLPPTTPVAVVPFWQRSIYLLNFFAIFLIIVQDFAVKFYNQVTVPKGISISITPTKLLDFDFSLTTSAFLTFTEGVQNERSIIFTLCCCCYYYYYYYNYYYYY